MSEISAPRRAAGGGWGKVEENKKKKGAENYVMELIWY